MDSRVCMAHVAAAATRGRQGGLTCILNTMALIRRGGAAAGSALLMLTTAAVLLLELLPSPAQALQNGAANVPPMGK